MTWNDAFAILPFILAMAVLAAGALLFTTLKDDVNRHLSEDEQFNFVPRGSEWKLLAAHRRLLPSSRKRLVFGLVLLGGMLLPPVMFYIGRWLK
jgi:hypothetical protein